MKRIIRYPIRLICFLLGIIGLLWIPIGMVYEGMVYMYNGDEYEGAITFYGWIFFNNILPHIIFNKLNLNENKN